MKYPSFKAQHGRKPIPGKDFDEEKGLCQDDYEYLSGTGGYSDDVKYETCPACGNKTLRVLREVLESPVYSGEYIAENDPEILYETHSRWMCECECGHSDAGYD